MQTLSPKAILSYGAMLSVPVLVVLAGLHFLGQPKPPAGPGAGTPDGHPVVAQASQEQQIAAMVDRLAKRLESNPEDGNGWLMLARSYSVLGKFEAAAEAYGQGLARVPESADTLADYADVKAMTQGGSLQGVPETLVNKALKLDPKHAKALALSGTAAFQRARYAQAIQQWEKALATMPANHELRPTLESSVADARRQLGK